MFSSPSTGKQLRLRPLLPEKLFLHLSVHWPYYCANSVLILFPSILSCPWTPYRSCRGGMEMGIISCSWSWCRVYKKIPPLILCFSSLAFLQQDWNKTCFCFYKNNFSLNYFVSIEVSRHFSQMILVTPVYPVSTWTNTLTCQEGIDSSFVDKSFGRVLLMYKSCLGDRGGALYLIKYLFTGTEPHSWL